MRICILCRLQILCICAGLAQSTEHPARVTYDHFNLDHGLSAPVTRIAQDSIGFLWLATTDGLNRFDGKNFVVYRNIAGDSTSLINNIINDLGVDLDGNLWVATNGGLCLYQFSQDAFRAMRFDNTREEIDRHRVMAVAASAAGGTWFASKTIVHRWKEGELRQALRLPGSENLSISYLFEDDKETLWIGTNEKLFAYRSVDESLMQTVISTPFTRERGLTVTIHPIVPYHGDSLLIGSWYGGVHKVVAHGNEIRNVFIEDRTSLSPRKHIVRGLCERIDGAFWVGTFGNGLAVLNPQTSEFTSHFHHDPVDPGSLSSEYVNDVYRDQSGILWIGTEAGLDKYDPLTKQFTSVLIPAGSNEFSVYRLPRSIVEDRDRAGWLWIAVSGVGLLHYHPQSGRLILYEHQPANQNSLPDNAVHVIYYDHLSRLWLGARSGIYIFDVSNSRFNKVQLPGGIDQTGVHTILQDEQQIYWFATSSNGVFSYDAGRDAVRSYTYKKGDRDALPDNRVFCMLMDSRHKLWIGTQNRGLCLLDPKSESLKLFEHDRMDMTTIPDNGIFDLHEDNHGQLWVATENGLARIDLATHQIENFSASDGLCNNLIYSITPGRNGELWLGTYNGLSRFDPTGRSFKNYYTQDGLPTNSISGSTLAGSDGTLYFGSPGTISYCRPERMQSNERIPRVIITGLRVFDKHRTVERHGPTIAPVHLSYKDNMLTLEFTALNFTNAEFNQYAYKLEGFDDQWIHCGSRQTATFTNLSGGSYLFRVKAANNDGLWNTAGSSVALIIHPPFWRTWWFYACCALALGLGLYFMYRLRINQIMKLQRIRTRISRDLHDDIGSTLSSINMISSMAGRSSHESTKINDQFQTIADASRQAMELMGDIVWSINPGNDRMEMVIIRMRQYASEILEAAGIEFVLEFHPSMRSISLPPAKRKDFYLIFKEAINNAAKYANARQLSIALRFEHKRTLYLEISDDGVGFNPMHVVSGNGLKNMRARALQLKGEISIESAPGMGTRICLRMPVIP